MKIVIILLFLTASVSAQNFFPSQVNNSYQVSEYSWGYSHGSGSWSRQQFKAFTILSDSIIADRRFINISSYSGHPFPENSLLSYEETEQKIYIKLPGDDSIYLAVDFNIAAGDTFISYIKGMALPFISNGFFNVSLFGDSVWSYQISYRNTITNPYTEYRFTFSKDIGLSGFYQWGYDQWSNSTFESKVVSAIVDTNIFNPITLNITSLTPLVNRPVNVFPFILTAEYYTNIDLVDTFYLKVIQIRGSDTITNYSIPFNEYNKANFYLFPEVGDKLLLKAFITDSSIFKNYDTYPDSGYAEILVLPSTVDVEDYNSPDKFWIKQNFPNPFNPSTTIMYNVPVQSFVTLSIYDVMGNEIVKAVNEEKQAGFYKYEFNGSGLASGVYFYKLTFGSKAFIKKMLLQK